MTPEHWQAAAVTLGTAALVAAAFTVLLDYALKRFDRSGLIRSIVAAAFFVVFFSFAIYFDTTFFERPMLVGFQCGLLGVASGQFGQLVANRKRTRAL